MESSPKSADDRKSLAIMESTSRRSSFESIESSQSENTTRRRHRPRKSSTHSEGVIMDKDGLMRCES